MTATKLAISMDEELAQCAREQAEAEGTTVSGWISEAVRQRVQNIYARLALEDYEREFGKITDEEKREFEGLWD
jgi:hypothetical protein